MVFERNWSPEQLQALRTRFPGETSKSLALEWGRTEDSIKERARKMGLHKRDSNPDWNKSACSAARWTEEDIGKLLRGYKDDSMSVDDIAKSVSKTYWAVVTKARDFSLKKNYRAQSTTFVVFGAKFCVVRASKIPFLKIHVDGEWVTYHRWLWERENGPIPEGMLIVFRDGRSYLDPRAISVSQMEMIDRAELNRRNWTFEYLPKELRPIAKLNRNLAVAIGRTQARNSKQPKENQNEQEHQ